MEEEAGGGEPAAAWLTRFIEFTGFGLELWISGAVVHGALGLLLIVVGLGVVLLGGREGWREHWRYWGHRGTGQV